MKLPPAILDDLKLAQDHLSCDQSPNWLAGYAGIIRGIADDIDRAVDREKQQLANESAPSLQP